eukprot:g78791.t1
MFVFYGMVPRCVHLSCLHHLEARCVPFRDFAVHATKRAHYQDILYMIFPCRLIISCFTHVACTSHKKHYSIM